MDEPEADGGESKAKTLKWTPRMEEAYDAALEQLGGLEFAKPKAVLELLQDEFPVLTIHNVKWHIAAHRRRVERHKVMGPSNIAPPTKWYGRMEEAYEAEVARQGGLHKARPKPLLDALQPEFPELTLQIVKWHLQGQRRAKQRRAQAAGTQQGQGSTGAEAASQPGTLGSAPSRSGGAGNSSQTSSKGAEGNSPRQQPPQQQQQRHTNKRQHSPQRKPPPQQEQEQRQAQEAASRPMHAALGMDQLSAAPPSQHPQLLQPQQLPAGTEPLGSVWMVKEEPCPSPGVLPDAQQPQPQPQQWPASLLQAVLSPQPWQAQAHSQAQVQPLPPQVHQLLQQQQPPPGHPGHAEYLRLVAAVAQHVQQQAQAQLAQAQPPTPTAQQPTTPGGAPWQPFLPGVATRALSRVTLLVGHCRQALGTLQQQAGFLDQIIGGLGGEQQYQGPAGQVLSGFRQRAQLGLPHADESMLRGLLLELMKAAEAQAGPGATASSGSASVVRPRSTSLPDAVLPAAVQRQQRIVAALTAAFPLSPEGSGYSSAGTLGSAGSAGGVHAALPGSEAAAAAAVHAGMGAEGSGFTAGGQSVHNSATCTVPNCLRCKYELRLQRMQQLEAEQVAQRGQQGAALHPAWRQ